MSYLTNTNASFCHYSESSLFQYALAETSGKLATRPPAEVMGERVLRPIIDLSIDFFCSANNFCSRTLASLNPFNILPEMEVNVSRTISIPTEDSKVEKYKYLCANYFGIFDEAYIQTMKVSDQIPWDKTNRIYVSFVTLNPEGELVLQTSKSDERIKTIVSLARKENPEMEIFIVSDYGPQMDLHYFNAAKNPKKFAKNVLNFLQKYQLNGISIDWQSPFIDFYRKDLKALLKACYELFDEEFQKNGIKYKVTHDVDPCWHSPKTVGSLKNVLDEINVMSYLCVQSLEDLVKEYSAFNFPKRKILVTVWSELNYENQESIMKTAKAIEELSLGGIVNWRMDNDSRNYNVSRWHVYGPSKFSVAKWSHEALCQQ